MPGFAFEVRIEDDERHESCGLFGQGGDKGAGGQRSDETLLTGTTAEQVKAAALAKVGSDATVERVETDGARLVLIGAGKQLPLSPQAWSGGSGQAARAWLERELAARGLDRSFNPRASRMTFRGTRVKKGR